jgi:hypothetical protein
MSVCLLASGAVLILAIRLNRSCTLNFFNFAPAFACHPRTSVFWLPGDQA